MFFKLIFKGQLGLGNNENQTKPQLIMNAKIKILSAGQYFTIIYKENGDLVGFGNSSNGKKKKKFNSFYFYLNKLFEGQLGLGNSLSHNTPQLIMNDPDIEWIGCGQSHHLIYKKDGILMGTGKKQK